VDRTKPTFSVPSEKGRVTVYYNHVDPHPTLNQWCSRQIGHVRKSRVLITVERWCDVERPGQLNEWGDWKEVHRSTELLQPNHPILPPMSKMEKDAWAKHGLPYVKQKGGTTIATLAGLLPGWDDTITFSPTRIPEDIYAESLWKEWKHPARIRAYFAPFWCMDWLWGIYQRTLEWMELDELQRLVQVDGLFRFTKNNWLEESLLTHALMKSSSFSDILYNYWANQNDPHALLDWIKDKDNPSHMLHYASWFHQYLHKQPQEVPCPSLDAKLFPCFEEIIQTMQTHPLVWRKSISQ
jgi:hypothetical protein